MHHSILSGLALLFGTPSIVGFVVLPSDLIRSSYSFEPRSSTYASISPPPFSTRNTSSSSSVYVPPVEIPVRIYGHFGPLLAAHQVDCYLRAQVTQIGDYEISYYFSSSLTSSLPNGNFAPILNRATRFDHLGDFDMPLFSIPSSYVPAQESCHVYVNVKSDDKTWSTVVSLTDEGLRTYQLPLNGGWFREKNSWTISANGISAVGIVYRDGGFANHYDSPKNGLVPFSKMKITLEASSVDLNLLRWGEGTLTAKNHVSDFSTGRVEGDYRIWDMEMNGISSSFSPSMKNSYLYNPGDGKTREGSTPRGLEFLTHSFYLPPCAKEEVGVKQYSFLLSFKNMGILGQTTLELPFTVMASPFLASGCAEGSYCVEVRD